MYTISYNEITNRNYVAKWDGSNWLELKDENNIIPYPSQFLNLCSDASGNIYLVGNFLFIVKWDGTSWSKVGADFTPNVLLSVISADDLGNVYAAGAIYDGQSRGYVVKWDGTSWSEVGTGIHGLSANDEILTMCTDPSHNLYVAGNFTNENGEVCVAKWDGTTTE